MEGEEQGEGQGGRWQAVIGSFMKRKLNNRKEKKKKYINFEKKTKIVNIVHICF